MARTKYTYSISNDFPAGKVSTTQLSIEIQSSNIVTALDNIDTSGNIIDIWFKAPLSTGDKTTFDGNATSPAGGLILSHDSSIINSSVDKVEISNIPFVTNIKPSQNDFTRIYMFSCDLTKKETWYIGSSGNSESFNANGSQATFNLAYGSGNGCAVIDLSHGKVTQETDIITPTGGSYVPVIKINGALQTEREMYELTGGHYEINYVDGSLTFFASPPSGNVVTIDYYVSLEGNGPIVVDGPPTGKKWTINVAEVQFSADINMADSFVQNVILDVPIFDASGNYLFTAYDQKAIKDVVYANVGTFLDYTNGSYPIIKSFGGSTRGLSQDTHIFRWEYESSMELLSSLNMRLKIWTGHGRGYIGERATVTVYGVEENE